MWPVLFSVFGIQIQSYGVSKALAALVAAWLLGRAFRRLGFPVGGNEGKQRPRVAIYDDHVEAGGHQPSVGLDPKRHACVRIRTL